MSYFFRVVFLSVSYNVAMATPGFTTLVHESQRSASVAKLLVPLDLQFQYFCLTPMNCLHIKQ